MPVGKKYQHFIYNENGEKCCVYALRFGCCLFQELLTIIQPKPEININQNRKRRKNEKKSQQQFY